MNREEYAIKTNGFVDVSCHNIITVLAEGYHPETLKYSEISKLLKHNKINVTMAQGQADRRIKQLQKIGYRIHEILWEGENKCSNTKILFTL